MHFLQDIAASDQITVDVELGKGGPVAVNLHFLSNYRVIEYIYCLVLSQT
jgi:hypothetical protein